MSAQFWYGLAALPVAALVAFSTVWLAVKTWAGLLKLADFLPRQLRKPSARYSKFANFIEDGDNRIDHVAIMATADNLHLVNTPLGVFVRAGGRIDNKMANKLRRLIKDQLIQDAKDDAG